MWRVISKLQPNNLVSRLQNAWSGDKPVYTAVLAQMQIVKVDESTKRDSATGAFLAPVKTYEHIGPTYDELNEEEAAAARGSLFSATFVPLPPAFTRFHPFPPVSTRC